MPMSAIRLSDWIHRMSSGIGSSGPSTTMSMLGRPLPPPLAQCAHARHRSVFGCKNLRDLGCAAPATGTSDLCPVIRWRGSAIAGAGQRGRPSAAASRPPQARSPERRQALAELNVERGGVETGGHSPIARQCRAEALGVGAGPERAVRYICENLRGGRRAKNLHKSRHPSQIAPEIVVMMSGRD